MYKLQFQINDKQTTYVENMRYKHWEDVRLIHVKSINGDLPEETKEEFANRMAAMAHDGNYPMPLIIFGDNIEITTYIIGPEAKPEIPGQLELEFNNGS